MPDEVVVDVISDETKSEEVKVEETKSEEIKTEEEKPEEVVETEEAVETEEDEETAKALELYKALQGPNAVALIERLARQAKLIGTEQDLSKKEQKKAVVDVLKEELGDEYGYLADKFGKAIERILNQELSEVRERVTSAEKNRRNYEDDIALSKFYKDNPDAVKHEKKLLDLMHKLPQSVNLDTYEYLTMLYSLAKNGRTTSSSVRSAVEKMKKNATDANLASSDVEESRVKKGPQRPTLDEALNAASKGVAWE
jgi:hypothetical protein